MQVIFMKQIILSNGQITLVDDEDFECLSQFKWHCCKARHTCYAQRHIKNPNTGRKTGKRMHRDILKTVDPKIVTDHIDHNGLNNQRSNLRVCSQAENKMNSRARKLNSIGYKGVSIFRNRNTGMWKGYNGPVFRSRITFNGTEIGLGYFKTAKEAALAYDLKCKELYGEFGFLNFPYS